MNKIKVLQMPIRNAKGGITQNALRTWQYIDKSRFRFDWVTLDKELSFGEELSAQGCEVHHLSCRQEDDKERFVAEMKEILSGGYDAVHLHTSFWRGFLAEELAIQAGVPKIIVHAHSTGIDHADPEERARLDSAHNEWKSKFNTGLATHFAACSDLSAEFLYGPQILRERIIKLKYAVDANRFAYNAKARSDMRYGMGLNDKFVILQPARFEYQKNHAFTLNMFARVIKEVPTAVLLLAGDGKLRGECENRASALGIAEKVYFLGFRDDVDRLLQAADLFILPSLFEGLPIAATEAQCSGVRCLFSDCISDEVVVSDNGTRLPLDIGVWISEIIKAAQACYKRRDRSLEVAAKGYSIKEQIKILEGIYANGQRTS